MLNSSLKVLSSARFGELEKLKSLPENMRISAVEKFLPKLKELSEFRQSVYVDDICSALKMKKKTIQKGIEKTGANSNQVNPAQISAKSEKQLDEGDKSQALDLLKDPDNSNRTCCHYYNWCVHLIHTFGNVLAVV